MLSFLHSGLLAADQTQRNSVSNDPIQASLAKGKDLRKAGKLADALREYNRALSLARQSNNTRATLQSLMLISAAEVMSYQYRSALAASRETFDTARKAGNNQFAGGASASISNIYMLLGDFQTAEAEARRAVDLLRLAPQNDPTTENFLLKSMQLVATLAAMQGKDAESESFFQQAIALAQKLHQTSLEANLWDVRGYLLMRANHLRAGRTGTDYGAQSSSIFAR